MRFAHTTQLLHYLGIGHPSANNFHKLEKRAWATSEPSYPSPWMNPNAAGWEQAYQWAKDFVSQMTLLEKVNLTTGVG